MKIARYWTRDHGEAIDPQGKRIRVIARGWSNDSFENARVRARDTAQRVAARIASYPGERRPYLYGDRPLPEPVVHEFRGGAVVTRNAYGALVLNADELMFVDVDRDDRALQAAVQAVAEGRGLSARIYRTAAGHRIAVTNRAFRAGTPESEALMNEFGADPIYMRLCRAQESFRARLTPKPWRCGFRGFRKPPVEFPYESTEDEARFRQWEAEYNRKIGRYATCRYVGSVGGDRIEPAFRELIEFHDQESKANSGLRLA